MKMKEPYGLVLASLGKPSSNVPFMMPKKTADTDPSTQIKVEDVIGSGPFVFKSPTNGSPARRSSSSRTPSTSRAPSRASGLAGGKVVKVDRVEWIAMPDVQTQVGGARRTARST